MWNMMSKILNTNSNFSYLSLFDNAFNQLICPMNDFTETFLTSESFFGADLILKGFDIDSWAT